MADGNDYRYEGMGGAHELLRQLAGAGVAAAADVVGDAAVAPPSITRTQVVITNLIQYSTYLFLLK
jgi:hypothetical protein